MKKRLPLDLLLLFVDILMVKLNIAHAFDYYIDNSSQMSAGDVSLPNEAAASNLKNNVLVNDAIKKVVRLLSSIKEDEQDPYVPKNGQPEDPFSTKYEHKPLVELGEIEKLNKKYFTDFQIGQDPEKMINTEEEYFPDRPVQREENFYQIDQLYKLNTPRVLRKAGHDADDDDDGHHPKARTTRKPEELKDTAEDDRKRLEDHSKDIDNVDDHNKDEEFQDDDPYSIKKAAMIDDHLLSKDLPDPYHIEKDVVHDTTHHPHDDHTPHIHDHYDNNYKNYFNDMPFKELIKSANPAVDPTKYPPRKLTVDFGYSFVDDKNAKKNKENNNNEDTSQPKDDQHSEQLEKPHNKHYHKISATEDDGSDSSDDKDNQPEKEKKMKKTVESPKSDDDSESEDYDAYSAPKDKQSQQIDNNEAIKQAVKILASIQDKDDRYKLVTQSNSELKDDDDDQHSDHRDSGKRKRKPRKKLTRKLAQSDDSSEGDSDSEENTKRKQRSKKRSRKAKDSEEHTSSTPAHNDEEHTIESPKNKMKRKTFRKMFYIDSEPKHDSPPQRKKQTKKDKKEKADKEAQLSHSDDEYTFHGDEVDKAKKKTRKEPTGKMYLSIDYQYDDGKNKKDGLVDDEASGGGERNRDTNTKSKRRPERAHARAKFVSTGRISQSK